MDSLSSYWLSSCSHELVLAKTPDLPEALLGRFLRSVVSFLHLILDPRSLICWDIDFFPCKTISHQTCQKCSCVDPWEVLLIFRLILNPRWLPWSLICLDVDFFSQKLVRNVLCWLLLLEQLLIQVCCPDLWLTKLFLISFQELPDISVLHTKSLTRKRCPRSPEKVLNILDQIQIQDTVMVTNLQRLFQLRNKLKTIATK